MKQATPVRALVHKLDLRSDALRQEGAEVVEGKNEERYQTTDEIRTVTGRNPQTLEEFLRENARWFAAEEA